MIIGMIYLLTFYFEIIKSQGVAKVEDNWLSVTQSFWSVTYWTRFISATTSK